MIIKKYQAQTEEEAILQARDDLGKDAIVMNIKKIKPKGIYKLFKKPVVEVTAAVDDAKTYSSSTLRPSRNLSDSELKDNQAKRFEDAHIVEEKSAIEEKLDSLQNMLKQQIQSNITVAAPEPVKEKEEINTEKIEKDEEVPKNDKKTQCLNLIKEKMMHV